METEEIYKDIPNYKGLYQISNISNVKSLEKVVMGGTGLKRNKERILKQGLNLSGYKNVVLHKDNKRKTFSVHQLMAITFLNHIPCGHNIVVDHINNDKSDNRIKNLQLISSRENVCKSQKINSSKYMGVSYNKEKKKYVANITINGKLKAIGSYKDEIEAAFNYQLKLSETLKEEKIEWIHNSYKHQKENQILKEEKGAWAVLFATTKKNLLLRNKKLKEHVIKLEELCSEAMGEQDKNWRDRFRQLLK